MIANDEYFERKFALICMNGSDSKVNSQVKSANNARTKLTSGTQGSSTMFSGLN